MITKYDRFLVESENKFKWEESDPEYYGITKYEWNKGKLNCFQNVALDSKNLDKVPFVFGTVDGAFNISYNNLTDLENCPEIVTGYFSCSYNEKLTSLKGSPIKVYDFYSQGNKNLPSYLHCPKFVEGKFYCMDNSTIEKKYDLIIDFYPLCIIKEIINSPYWVYTDIFNIVKDNSEKFIHLLDDKVAFHQMVMRLNPEMIQHYKDHSSIPIPSKKSILFNI